MIVNYLTTRILRQIEAFVRAEVQPTTRLLPGTTAIELDPDSLCSMMYMPGDEIRISHVGCLEQHTVQTVCRLDGVYTLHLCSGIASEFPALNPIEPIIQKTYLGRRMHDIVVGNPDFLPNYPAITIESTSLDREPYTLSMSEEVYTFLISVWCDGVTYDDTYTMMTHLTDRVMNALTNVKPSIYLFDPRIENVRYDIALDQDHLLKAAEIEYSVKTLWETKRYHAHDQCETCNSI